MTDPGAYQDEMARRYGLTDEEIERLVAGTPHDDANTDLAMFLADVKAQAGVDEVTAARHLNALSHEAERLSAQGVPPRPQRAVTRHESPWRRVMRRGIRLAALASAGVLVLSGSLIGLAFAGVDLPGAAAEQALESVTNVELPNQQDETPGDNGKSVADDVKAVHEATTERGCEFGQAVSEAASQNRRGEGGSDVDPCTRAGRKEKVKQNEAQGSGAIGDENSAEGRAKAADKSDGRSEAGPDNAGTKGDQSEAAPDEPSSKKEENRPADAGPPEDAPGANDDLGHSTAEEAKSDRGPSDAGASGKP